MATARRRPPLKVDIPRPSKVPIRLGKVGIIAALGFVAGIVWPRLAGLRLVPALPAPAGSSPDLTGAPPDEPAAASALPSAAAAPAPRKPESLEPGSQPPVVGEAQVTSCRDAGSAKVEHCDAVDFDRVARDRLSSLDDCPSARRIAGVLSLGFELDFKSERIVEVTSGKSTSLDPEPLKALLDCYRQSFANVSLAAIPHEHERYTIFYRIELAAAPAEPGAAASSTPLVVTPASGTATVSWETALIHATPDKDGKVVARVLSGTRVAVTGRSGDWYRVKYDSRGREGWVFRTAIGM